MFLIPWEGPNYQLGINNERIMIFGESHYDDESFGEEEFESDFTVKAVRNILANRKSVRFFEYIGNLFDEDWTKIWNNVAFANLIQFVLLRGEQPNNIQIESITSFYKYLELLKPDKAIICSSRAWLNWFPKHIDNKEGISLDESIRLGKSWVFKYPHSEGSTMVIGINHSSSREPDFVQTWKPVVADFLNYQS